jgi:hypothetical protein
MTLESEIEGSRKKKADGQLGASWKRTEGGTMNCCGHFRMNAEFLGSKDGFCDPSQFEG